MRWAALSSRLLLGETFAVCDFVAERIGVEDFGECQALGFIDKDGVLEAGVVFNNWNPKTGVIEISAAARNRTWGTRERLRLIFDYPFGFCRMVVARTSEHNPGPLRIWKALGAKQYRIEGLRAPDEAEIVTTLTADQWRSSRFSRR